MTAGFTLANDDFTLLSQPDLEQFDNLAQVALVDVAKKGKGAQEGDQFRNQHCIASRVAFRRRLAEVFKSDRTGTAAARDHAIRDLIGTLVFDDDFSEITV